ncbi:type II CAAX endopeptidase family protein [Microbacterium telephonicum]|uniref:CAAX prenyl protease 2/Lysostaphin resistance protein A-like domain-containing protein n=1 Tax=Microbacterium telephonicum TaxID=1714841 RepID=A0A498BY98_9MICO|nr:type II CAAX endopeptidase family protein [Microbacterium telephonicum]RLK47963.1 hypothetical protein C7474_2562 [Microbacterium telephonicum]
MTKAPGSGSGPSSVSAAADWARPWAALAVVAFTLVVDGALVLTWPGARANLGIGADALGALLDIVVIAGPLALGAVVAARVGGPGIRRALGLRFRAIDLALGLFVALIARAVLEIVQPTVGSLGSPFADGDQTLVLVVMALGAVLLVPVCEELLFRGALQRGLETALRGSGRAVSASIAVIVSTVVFVLLHVLPYGASAPIGAVLSPALVGVASGILVAVTGRLAPGILVHVFFNLGGVLLLLF